MTPPGTAAEIFRPVEPLTVTFVAVAVVCVVEELMLFCAVVTDAAVTLAVVGDTDAAVTVA